jgi:hypothetical protein
VQDDDEGDQENLMKIVRIILKPSFVDHKDRSLNRVQLHMTGIV